ncbi:MAG: hypothetical protein CFE24_15155 [Flavobacterium sp. BFFFF2]|nr:MAG: hypothetical protein CFE24_15155 [Flavobacterium sp. BFFFF2]
MDIILQQLIQDFEKHFKPDPDAELKESLRNRLGDCDNKGYYRTNKLIVYLRITQSTYNRIVWQQFGLKLDRIHYKQVVTILLFIEGKLSYTERKAEEQKYLVLQF